MLRSKKPKPLKKGSRGSALSGKKRWGKGGQVECKRQLKANKKTPRENKVWTGGYANERTGSDNSYRSKRAIAFPECTRRTTRPHWDLRYGPSTCQLTREGRSWRIHGLGEFEKHGDQGRHRAWWRAAMDSSRFACDDKGPGEQRRFLSGRMLGDGECRRPRTRSRQGLIER